MDIQWFFPSTGGGIQSGPNDPLVTTFLGDYKAFLAREIIQNSIDARDSYSAPVTVVFSKERISSQKIPDISGLEEAISLASLRFKGDKRFSEPCDDIVRKLKEGRADILRASDYNTKGLVGADDDIDSSFCKLVRATGANTATGVGGGSYGIGKGAPFVTSLARTVLYSTKNIHGEHIFSGSARLASFEQDGDIKQSVGSLVINRKSIRDYSAIPQLFVRDENGTDIYIVGYKDWNNPEWEHDLVIAVLNNFWMAVANNDLVVKFRDTNSDKVVIAADTIEEVMADYLDTPEQQEGSNKLVNAKYYYEAFKHPDVQRTLQFSELGECQLFIKRGDKFPCRVLTMRKPQMAVEYMRFNAVLPEGYAGVFICTNDKGNDFLRQLEPPQHNKWDGKILPGSRGKDAIQFLRSSIRNALRDLDSNSQLKPEEIPGLSDYLPRDDERDDLNQYAPTGDGNRSSDSDTESALESTQDKQIAPAPSKPRILPKSIAKLPGAGGGRKHISKGKGSGVPNSNNPGSGDDGVGGNKFIELDGLYFRAVPCSVNGDASFYKVILRSPSDQSGMVSFKVKGDDKSYDLTLETAYDADMRAVNLENNYLPVELVEDQTAIFFVRFSEGTRRRILEVR